MSERAGISLRPLSHASKYDRAALAGAASKRGQRKCLEIHTTDGQRLIIDRNAVTDAHKKLEARDANEIVVDFFHTNWVTRRRALYHQSQSRLQLRRIEKELQLQSQIRQWQTYHAVLRRVVAQSSLDTLGLASKMEAVRIIREYTQDGSGVRKLTPSEVGAFQDVVALVQSTDWYPVTASMLRDMVETQGHPLTAVADSTSDATNTTGDGADRNHPDMMVPVSATTPPRKLQCFTPPPVRHSPPPRVNVLTGETQCTECREPAVSYVDQRYLCLNCVVHAREQHMQRGPN